MSLHQKLNRITRPPHPALVVTAQPFGKSGRWWSIICPTCNKLHVHGDLPAGLYSKREAACNGPAYWIHRPLPATPPARDRP